MIDTNQYVKLIIKGFSFSFLYTIKMENGKGLSPLKVVELFAGVGGFRLGLEGTKERPKKGYKIVWANQWEPSTKAQHAATVYREKFHDGKEPNRMFNEDINKVVDMDQLPIPKHDLLVGGFPCQDYSVARTLSQAVGIEGKKGVLWWAIHKIISRMGKSSPKYLMLENVDRLLKSPAKQRGRDFGIILASLSDLGYAVEWRVINAADYGMPQRRRRVFIMAYKKGSPVYKNLINGNPIEWLINKGVIAEAFPVRPFKMIPLEAKVEGNLASISDDFLLPFENTGLMIDRELMTMKTRPEYSGHQSTLGSILLSDKDVLKEYFIDKDELKRWTYLKNAKKEKRTSSNGFSYSYNEGAISFPDQIDMPSRTIVTGEGGSTPSRFKHVVRQGRRYRRLTTVELERLCMFPDNHTFHPSISNVKRAFFMGNALVVGVIERLGESLLKFHHNRVSIMPANLLGSFSISHSQNTKTRHPSV